MFLLPNANFAQLPDLGAASGFAVFSADGAFNLEIADISVVTGDVGTNVGAFFGFPPGTLIGQKHVADPATAAATPDVLAASTFLTQQPCGITLTTPLGGEGPAGQLLTPNIYCLTTAAELNGNLTLDGQNDPSAIFIFKINGAFVTGTLANVFLINSASLNNVYWQINGAFTLGDYSVFRGNVIASGAIHLLQASELYGRALTTAGAIDMHNNTVTIGTSLPVATTWNGSTNSEWHNPANWSDGFPGDNTTVTIPSVLTNYPTITSATVCKNITITSGASLLDNGYLTVTGTATVQRAVTSDFNWHFISSPVSSQNICDGNFAPLTGNFDAGTGATFDFYKWSEPVVPGNLNWINLKTGTWGVNTAEFGLTPQFEVTKGYLVAYGNDFAGSSTKSFIGTLNTGDQTVTLTKDGNGWNLIGNPFPSAIDWDHTGIVKTGLANGYYYIYNAAGGETDKYEYYLDAGHKTAGTNGNISSAQGYFVNASGTSLFIPISACVHDNNWLKNTETTPVNHVTLTVANAAGSDEAYIIFESVGSMNKGWYDADKLNSMNLGVPQVFTLKDNNHQIAINSLPLFNTAMVVPVGMVIPTDGNYTLQLSGFETFPTLPVIMLEDLKNNSMQNMFQNPVYSFSAATTDNANRFLLHFAGSIGISDKTYGQSFHVFASDNSLFVIDNTGKNQGNVNVYNMMGQLIASTRLNRNATCKINLNVPTGYYIVKVVSNDQTYSGKVFIN